MALTGISSGILHNAHPLTAAQIKALEQKVLETGEAFVYLDENRQLCFAAPFDPDLVKELAWHSAHELKTTGEILTKTEYIKQSQKTFSLDRILQKQSYDEPWILQYTQPNFILANGDIFVTNDGLIFNTKEI